MDYFFFRFETTEPTNMSMTADEVRVVVIVDTDERLARMRLQQMHPTAVVQKVQTKAFVIPEHRKVPGGPHRSTAAHRHHRVV